MDSLPSIDLDFSERMKNDKEFRQSYFLAESSAKIAQQLISLRRKRGLDQKQVAELVETGQPAISRVESADYGKWSFNTLRKLAQAMDARIRVLIEPAEDVLFEYESQEVLAVPELSPEIDDLQALMRKILERHGTQPQSGPERLEGSNESSAATAGRDVSMLKSAKTPSLTLIGDEKPSLTRTDFGRKSERPQGRKILEGTGAPWN